MHTRRTFMKGTAVAAALASSMAAHAASLAAIHVPGNFALGLFDEALGGRNGFSLALAANGAEALAVGRDMTAVWLRVLRETGPVIGLTRPDAVFCLQQLSPASGRALRIDRVITADEAVQLRAGDGHEIDQRLARFVFDALGPGPRGSPPDTHRPHVVNLASHRSDGLILWTIHRMAAN